jgi:O-antigen/teichoic acid export membrane protein
MIPPGIWQPIQEMIEKIRAQSRVIFSKNGTDVLWNFASFVVMGCTGILLNLIIANRYSTETLGAFSQVYSFYLVISQLSAAGVHLSTLKYVAEFACEPEKYREIAFSALTVSALMAIPTVLFVWLIRSKIASWMGSPAVGVGLAWATPGLFFFTLNKVYLSVYNGLSRMKHYAVFQTLRYLLMLSSLLVMTVFNRGGIEPTFILSSAECILFFILSAALLNELNVPTWRSWIFWSRKHVSFGARGFISNVLLGLNPRIDIILLGYFSTDRVVGVFSLAASIAEALYQLPIVIRTNINPRLVQLISTHRLEELKQLARRSIRWVYIGMLAIGLALIAIYPLGLQFVKNREEFLLSWPIFAILTLGFVLSSGYSPFSNILLLAGRPGLNTFMILIQVTINFTANLILIPFFGGIGAAVATALSYAFLIVLVKSFTRKIIGVAI